jgi:hypothetical protein
MITTFDDGLLIEGNGTSGLRQLVLVDSTNTTVSPQKTLRANGTNGNLEVVNNNETQVLLSLTDPNTGTFTSVPGSLTVTGGISELGVFNTLGYGMTTSTGVGAPATNTTALQNAINACSGAGGGTVVIPAGIYQINGSATSPIVVPGKVRILGQPGATVLEVQQDASLFSLQGNIISLEHLQITYPATSSGSACIGASEVNTLRFEDVNITNAAIGWYIFDCSNVILFQCSAQGTATGFTGLWIDGGASGSGGSLNVHSIECTFSGFSNSTTNEGSSVALGHCQTISFLDCTLTGSYSTFDIGNGLLSTNPQRGAGGIPTGTWSGIVTQLIDVTRCGCGGDAVQGSVYHGFWAHPVNNGTYPWTVRDIRISDSTFRSATQSGLKFYVEQTSEGQCAITDVQLSNLTCVGSPGAGIWINGGTNYNIIGGIFAGNDFSGILIDGLNYTPLPPGYINISGITTAAASGFGTYTQPFAIYLAGTFSNIMITGSDLSNSDASFYWLDVNANTVGVVGCLLSPAGSGANIFAGTYTGLAVGFWDCPGYNDQSTLLTSTTPSSGAHKSAASIVAPPYLGPMKVYVAGGAPLISVGAGGSPTATGLTNGTFLLQPLQTITLTYGGMAHPAPTSFLAIGC